MKRFQFKSFVAGILFCAMVFSCFTVYAEYATKTIEFKLGDIRVKIDGEEIYRVNSEGNPVEVFIYDNDIYIPVISVLTGIVNYDIQENEESVVLSIFSNASDVKLTDATSIEDYLIENYSLIRTSYGNCRLEFNVFERSAQSEVYDYSIKIVMDSLFYYDVVSSISLLTEQERKIVNSEIKDHMDTLAKDLIKRLPGKKLKGQYDQSYYKNPKTKNIKGFVSVVLHSWTNYKYEPLKEKYNDVKPTDTLIWNTSADTK